MRLMNELPSFLVWCLFRSWIPTCLLSLTKIAGLLPISWTWAVLPTVSALFFLGSFLLAGAIAKTAYATSRIRH